MEFFMMFFKIIVSLIIILGIILILFKLSNKKISDINENKYIKVIDRVQIGKDSYILIIKVGQKGHVMSLSAGKTEMLEALSQEEILNIENEKSKKIQDANIKYENIVNLIKEKVLILKRKLKGAEDEK